MNESKRDDTIFVIRINKTRDMNWKKQYGKMGEDKAVAYLEKEGYRILERNWRFRHWEIDIIAEKDDVIVFVEVKTRRGDLLLREIISQSQIKTLINAAECYLRSQTKTVECRFDVILLRDSGSNLNLEHIKDAFR